MVDINAYLTSSNIQLVANIFLMIFTGVLAYYTYYLYQETKKNRVYQIQLNNENTSSLYNSISFNANQINNEELISKFKNENGKWVRK
jgi:cbb3-type cytochrome oxidase subunit 3